MNSIVAIIIILLYFNTEFEAGFIRLLDKLTNGSRIEVNETGEKKCRFIAVFLDC